MHPISLVHSPSMEQILRHILGSMEPVVAATAFPVNIRQSETGYEIHAILPGMERDDIQLEIKEGLLTIRAKPQVETEDTPRADFWHMEMKIQESTRGFRLPRDVNPEQITAEYRNGILVVRLPKRAEATPRVIEVR